MCCSAKSVKLGETGRCIAIGLSFVAACFGLSYGWPHMAALGFTGIDEVVLLAVLALSLRFTFRKNNPVTGQGAVYRPVGNIPNGH